MKNTNAKAVLGLVTGIALANTANAAVVVVNSNVTTSTTWTNNNVYRLANQVYVMPGATLTIEPGTVIASTPTVNGSGSLAVTRGAQIFVNGNEENPVIMTSTDDVATWDPLPAHPTGRDPKTGTWREAANEWGNLTIMGRGFISASCIPTNSSTCNVNNLSPMEGLIGQSKDDPNVRYGGNQDNDDSGSISYLSIRYGGRVVGLGNELNGLSLGGVGRNTDINHVEIMNNVDDGIEIWGGTVNIKHFSIWNVGDDSLDIDQGWRGKAQFGLVVQGYSVDAAQGSGVGDNCLEMDGAEGADAQPITTTTLYNLTVIGQPVSGDHGTAWRDNAHVQLRNCIFMDLGERLIQVENGDNCTTGYGFNGTPTWAQTWALPYTAAWDPEAVNQCSNPEQRYQAQSAGDPSIGQGFLAEMTDSVFFRNLNNAYNNANGSDFLGVTVAGGNAPAKGNIVAANMPIQALTRTSPIPLQGGSLTMLRVTSVDPRPAANALNSNSTAPNDGFFTQADYRGAFGPNENWLCTWTAADAYGFSVAPPAGCGAEPCPADTDGSGAVDVDDLVAVILAWGPCVECPADIDDSGTVDVDDLVAVILGWGPCS
jgi:hypothetical protein